MIDIRSIRKRLKLSQAEMADRLGVHQATLSRFETGALKIDKRTLLAVQAISDGETHSATSSEAA